jgi:hypothetical protein
MSLTSYRAAPPRGGWGRGGRTVEVRPAREASRGGLGAAVQAWRRPALPPLGGQYPGRGAVSRPSSEWGRVVPARCGHQAGTTARGPRPEDKAPGRIPAAAPPGLVPGVVKRMGMGSRGRRSETRDQPATLPGSGTVVGPRSSVLCPRERRRERARRAWGWAQASLVSSD